MFNKFCTPVIFQNAIKAGFSTRNIHKFILSGFSSIIKGYSFTHVNIPLREKFKYRFPLSPLNKANDNFDHY